MKRLATLLLGLTLSLTAFAGPASAGATDPASRDKIVRHSGQYWVWFGPQSWDAAYGAYGITVLGDQHATLDLGFSSTICAAGATWEQSVKNYFKAKRTQVTQTYGWRITSKSKVAHPRGTDQFYRRQTLKFTTQSGGVKYQGVGVFDYDYTTTVDGLNYCYQRSLAKDSQRSAWKSMRKALDAVERSLAYSGPGAPGESPDDPKTH